MSQVLPDRVSFTVQVSSWYYRLLERYCTMIGKDSNILGAGGAERVSVSGQPLDIGSSFTYWPARGLAPAAVASAAAVIVIWLQFILACGSVGDAPFGAGRLSRSCRRTRAARGRLTGSRPGSGELIPPPAGRVTIWAG